jgi:hypothetical protein
MTDAPYPERVVTPFDLERRFRSVESATKRALAGSAVVPGMVTLLVFADDLLDDARAFAGALREHFRESRPDLYVEVLEFTFPRPHGLKAAWQTPRQFLDYQPDPVELHDLRPDLRPPPPGVVRMDWNP